MSEDREPQNIACGLDVGTTKICTVVVRAEPGGQISVLGAGICPAKGLQRGVVVDRELAVEAIRESVGQAQEACGIEIGRAVVGVTGAHISSLNVTGRSYVTGSHVSQEDVDRAIESALDAVPLAMDRRVIDYFVREFRLDGERGIRRPLGMVGKQLDVELHVVTGRGSLVDNVLECVEEVGVEVARVTLEPMATGKAVLTEAEMDLGCVVVDIGGGTTDIAAFVDGSICHSSAVAIAGNHVTQDLAKLLRVSREEAERIKREAGHAVPEEVPADREVAATLVGTGERAQIRARLIAEIIEARMEEIFEMVGERLEAEGLFTLASAGVVLAGGGAQLGGVERLASRVLGGVPVRIGTPMGLAAGGDLVAEPLYATAVGLAKMACESGEWIWKRGRAARAAQWLERAAEWLGRVFRFAGRSR